ncbi:MAG: LptF/LptG family permease [Endomicrobiales bacterium]
MKLLHRYILIEFAESFIFGLLVFSSILLLDQVFQLINLFLNKGVSGWIIAKLFILILPNIFSLTIPMSALLGILLAYGRLSEDNEITALRSSGVTYISFTGPVVLLVSFLCLFLVYFNMTLSPATHQQFRKLYQEILSQRPLVKFDEKSITTLGEYRLFVQRIDKKDNSLHGLNIYKFSPDESDAPWRISASSATVSVTPRAVVFDLNHGYWQKPNPARPENLVHMNFTGYQFAIPLGANSLPFSQSLREMTGTQLKAEMVSYRKKNLPTNFLENEYWLRWVLSLAPLVFTLVGIPLAIVTERGGKSIGFGLSLGVIFAYYLLLVTGINIGEKGVFPSRFILWLPNAATFIAGVFLWKRMLKT